MTRRRNAPVGVMIIEDSDTVRHVLIHIISQDKRLKVVAAVASAEEALELLPVLSPDIISMDIRLPGMDGLEAIRRIMNDYPTPIVVIAGTFDDTVSSLTMQALRAGALAVVEKPVGIQNATFDSIAETIQTQLYIMSQVAVIRRREAYARPAGSGEIRLQAEAASACPPSPQGDCPPQIVAIAASTGGPPALASLLGQLPADFPIPIVVVQHMGARFMEGFAAWLDGVIALKVRIAREGEAPQAGYVYVAPGDRHLRFSETRQFRICDSVHYRGQRPSANVLFSSVASAYGSASIGGLLTGMGDDGAEGLRAMRNAGAYTMAEDEASAVVYGMPRAAVRLGAVCLSASIQGIANRLATLGGVAS